MTYECETKELLRAFTELVKQATRFLKHLDEPEIAKGHFDVQIGLVQQKQVPKGNMTSVSITNEQQVVVTLTPKTDKGKPAKLDGVPTWTVQSGDSVVTPSDDGLSATFVSSDTPGDTVVLVEADADLGAGVTPISESITLTVSSATATNLGVSVGTPTDKP